MTAWRSLTYTGVHRNSVVWPLSAESQVRNFASILRLVISLLFAIIYACVMQEEETVE
jgi:hypothetical protein